MTKIGYTLGCFDVLHLGHIKLLSNAKGLCDKLIVGVLDDDYILKHKKRKIFSLEERIALLKSIKYCDVVVPETTLEKMFLYKKYKFDYLFVGDDWMNSQQYHKWEKELSKVGCKVIYFPYTKGVCSSKIKNVIINQMSEKGNE